MRYFQIEASGGALVSRIGPFPAMLARALTRRLAKLHGRTLYLREMTTNRIVYGATI